MVWGGTTWRRARRLTVTGTIVATTLLTSTLVDAPLARSMRASAAPAPAPAGRMFRLVRAADGQLVVQRPPAPNLAKAPRPPGGAAATAGWEPDSVVHATADAYEPQQWGLVASGFDN